MDALSEYSSTSTTVTSKEPHYEVNTLLATLRMLRTLLKRGDRVAYLGQNQPSQAVIKLDTQHRPSKQHIRRRRGHEAVLHPAKYHVSSLGSQQATDVYTDNYFSHNTQHHGLQHTHEPHGDGES